MKRHRRQDFLRFLGIFILLISANLYGCKSKHILAEQNVNDNWFQIAVLPDTQYYTAEKNGGKIGMFEEQINWILKNYADERIAYVAQVGDISDHGEKFMVEWERARDMMYRLEKPLPNFPNGIPYGVAVGNHDTSPNGKPKLLEKGYEQSFGRKHFLGRAYYGGSMGDLNRNDNHYDLFSAGGKDFIVLYLAYNEQAKDKEIFDVDYQKEVFDWADRILDQYKDRKAIVVSHSILKKPAGSNSNFVPNEGKNDVQSNFTAQGKEIYENLKEHANVFMMLCGHISGEGYRLETFNGNTIKMYLADYQSRRDAPFEETNRNGGGGLMRVMKINLTKETLSVRTLRPIKDAAPIWERGADSEFTHDLWN